MKTRKIRGWGVLTSLVLAVSLVCALFSSNQPSYAWSRSEASQFYDFVLYGPDGTTEVTRCRAGISGLTYGTVNILTEIREVGRVFSDKNAVMDIKQDSFDICNSDAFVDTQIKDTDGSWHYSLKMYNIDGKLVGESEPFYFSGSRSYAAGFRINCSSDLECSGEATSSTGYVDADIDTEALTHSTMTDKYGCSEATGKLGWLMCPVMEGIANTLSTIWNDYISPLLEIDPAIVGETSATFEAWKGFRAVANILFVIVLLIVIFSQLTGFGIDNYGIKKSLPRIVIAAILVNLSFIICELAIDVSNIVGSSIYDFLSGLGGSLTIPSAFASGSSAGAATTTTAVTALAAGVAYGTVFVITNGVLGTIIILLIALISAVVALLGLFLLLSVRQSLIIMVVILSPLAVICYMLPNTKKLFDRWLKIFEGLIFVFPICGLVVGGGMLASKIILNSASSATGLNAFFMVITAVVAEVMPFFLIPSLIRGAFKATGTLGAKLTGLTTSLPKATRAGLENKVNNGALMKTYQQGRALGKANKVIEKHNRRYGSGLPPTSGLKRLGYNMSIAQVNQAKAVSAGATKSLSDIYRESDKGAVENELKDSLQKLDPQRFAAAFRELLNKGGEEEALRALYNNSAAMNDPRLRAVIEREAGSTNVFAMKEYAKWKATPAGANGTFKSFVDSGALAQAHINKGETSFANLSKDSWKFYAQNAGAFANYHDQLTANGSVAAMSARGVLEAGLGRAAESLTAADQANEYAEFAWRFAHQTSNTATGVVQQNIVNNITDAGAGTMFDVARGALADDTGPNVSAWAGYSAATKKSKVDARFSQFVNLRSGKYPDVVARMNNNDRATYGV